MTDASPLLLLATCVIGAVAIAAGILHPDGRTRGFIPYRVAAVAFPLALALAMLGIFLRSLT